jgi:hypothetical protein
MINGIIFVSRGTTNLSNNSLILLPKAISKKKLLVDKLQKWTLSNLTNKKILKIMSINQFKNKKLSFQPRKTRRSLHRIKIVKCLKKWSNKIFRNRQRKRRSLKVKTKNK